MAYNSSYTGPQIDTAVGEVQSRVWDPVVLDVATTNWQSASGQNYLYSLTFYVTTLDAQSDVRPLVWFIADEDGSRYYVDYTVSSRGGSSPYYYTIVVHSNKQIAGEFMIFGHMLGKASSSQPTQTS